MNLQEYISELKVTLLTKNDIESLYRLCKSNPIYYKYLNEKLSKEKLSSNLIGTPTIADRKNKYYYGIWKEEKLIAALELILFYPDNISAMIGFFMVHKKYQNLGLGSSIVQSTIQYLKKMKFKYIVLSYVLGNEQSHQFWLKNGFVDTEDEDIFDDITLKAMELNITENQKLYGGNFR